MLLGSSFFLLVLALLLGLISFGVFSSTLYGRYDSKLKDIITYVEHHADVDDLARCVETGERSDTYREFQTFLNGMVDDLGLEYLYIVIPSDSVMTNVISATSAEERAAGEEDMPLLATTDAYSAEELARYRSYWDAQDVSFFQEASGYGEFYTAVKPLRDSSGKTIALICADLSLEALHRNMAILFGGSVFVTLVLFGLFAVFIVTWSRKRITGPLRSLEESAREFASKSHDVNDVGNADFRAIDTGADDEIASLSKAIAKMAADVQAHAQEAIAERERANEAERKAAEKAYEQVRSESETYHSIARALSDDYSSVYYVDLDTGRYISYRHDTAHDDLAFKHVGEDFFGEGRRQALEMIYEPDRKTFEETMNRESILKAIDDHGAFTFAYRLFEAGALEPHYVGLKASRAVDDDHHLVFGVSDVDAEMRQREQLERIQQEQATYARITALAGNFLAIYTVNPDNGRYVEYSGSDDIDSLAIAREGDDFLVDFRRQVAEAVYPEDREMVLALFTKERVMRGVLRDGIFVISYRHVVDGEPLHVSLRVALIEENDEPLLIVGLSDVEAQVKRDQEYAAAQQLVNRDALTGVKSKHAYLDVEAALEQRIADGEDVAFGLVVCDVNDLKLTNDTYGHQAGDELLQSACATICQVFKHSPVFRIGGDEFTVVLQGHDYEHRDELVKEYAAENDAAFRSGKAAVAWGVATYQGNERVGDVFKRADEAMYALKKHMKVGR